MDDGRPRGEGLEVCRTPAVHPQPSSLNIIGPLPGLGRSSSRMFHFIKAPAQELAKPAGVAAAPTHECSPARSPFSLPVPQPQAGSEVPALGKPPVAREPASAHRGWLCWPLWLWKGLAQLGWQPSSWQLPPLRQVPLEGPGTKQTSGRGLPQLRGGPQLLPAPGGKGLGFVDIQKCSKAPAAGPSRQMGPQGMPTGLLL